MATRLQIFSGNSNVPLVQEVCDNLHISLGEVTVKHFSDGEISVDIGENVRGMDVFVVQSTCTPANEYIMEMLIMLDALKRASAGRITLVIPYYAYARQDRKVSPRAPISAKLLADLITVAGANRVLTMDLHAGQIQGFFNIPVDNLYGSPVLYDYVKTTLSNDLVIVSPDAGGVERARAFAARLNAGLAIIDKRRPAPNVSEVMHVIGDVKNKRAIIVDDMIDTGGTMVQAAEALARNGAQEVYACCTHAVLSGSAVEKINNSVIEEVIVTNTIPLSDEKKKCRKVKVLSVAGLLSEAVRRIHCDESVSALFV
ncbi:MAG TPA: ribose-phosphate pyrophosphokinase [Thermodesulfobacteriota bacterium]|nr:ribose-phosphate pyrophosphokinase [Deltaproteobacteria bacterium]HNR11886.1 ribose-phosphate pyrophosphokinase [Thermodesulfobacteriota bacterium]HNU70147.1 ribose-phosphate pyrophosphokinase [Thermodesulfobacteriota bacterium]HQO77666.1 ribose-phosphate pyrophosphokinase [Thermodesulfobacteriota bacterium]